MRLIELNKAIPVTLGRFAMRFFAQFSLVCVISILLGTATSQVKSSPTGRIFRNEMFGLTYTIPGNLAPSPESQLPQDPTGREKFVLALWDNPRRTPVPHVAFMYDTKVSGKLSGWSPEAIAEGYLGSLKPGEGYKMGKPRKVSMAGNTLWRMDYWRPDDSGQSYNSSIVYPFKGEKVLFIQMNAASQRELDLLVDSLQGLKFDQK
jgi:hypothetical protein